MALPIQQVIIDPKSVNERLKEIFTVDMTPFLKTVQEGFNLRNEVTSNHPKTYSGTRHYCEGTAIIREELFTSGYQKYERQNSDWVLNKELGVLINFMAGNSSVGLVDQNPTNDKPFKKPARNRNPKGIMFSKIAKAQLSRDLFTDVFPVNVWCWVLMYHIDYKAKVIRSEISCPSKMGVNGKYIEEYYERIILSEISFDPETEFDNITSPSGDAPEITVNIDVRRKA